MVTLSTKLALCKLNLMTRELIELGEARKDCPKCRTPISSKKPKKKNPKILDKDEKVKKCRKNLNQSLKKLPQLKGLQIDEDSSEEIDLRYQILPLTEELASAEDEDLKDVIWNTFQYYRAKKQNGTDKLGMNHVL